MSDGSSGKISTHREQVRGKGRGGHWRDTYLVRNYAWAVSKVALWVSLKNHTFPWWKSRDENENVCPLQRQWKRLFMINCVTAFKSLLGLPARGLGMMLLLSPLQKSGESNPRPPLYPLHGAWCNSCASLWIWVCCLGGDPQYLLLPPRWRGGWVEVVVAVEDGEVGGGGGCMERGDAPCRFSTLPSISLTVGMMHTSFILLEVEFYGIQKCHRAPSTSENNPKLPVKHKM